jgi:MFS transporter, ACS family, D-galactonate transporter
MKNVQHPRPTRARFKILALLFVSVVINYMDRTNISVAATAITEDLKLTPVQLGILFSAFGWTYAALQIPGGVLVDRFAPRALYAFCLIGWSAMTLFQGLARGFTGLLGLRLAIGVFEAPSYPINNRVVTGWFPEHERATAIAIYTCGQFLGLAFVTPVLAAIQVYFGWRGLFIITGLAGIAWGLIWYVFYRNPKEHPGANLAELNYIERGGGLIHGLSPGKEANKRKFEWRELKKVLSYRKLWGVYIGQFALNSTLWFFLTWFPTYLVKYRGLDFLKSGFLASAPFLAAFTGLLASGITSDYLLKKGVSINIARKTPVIFGLLLASSIVGANYVDSTAWVIFFMALAFFGNGFATITWVFVSTLAPKNLIGLTGGVFNFIGNLASIVIPVTIGYLAKDGDFEPALLFIGSITVIGACSYLFIVGKIERIDENPEVA